MAGRQTAVPAQADNLVSFKLKSFTSGAGFSEGLWLLISHNWHVWDYGTPGGPQTLSCQVKGQPVTIDAKGGVFSAGEPIEQEYSAGSGAAEAFSISPDGGSLIPTGQRTSLGKGSNFYEFLQNFVNAGFPEENFDNNLHVFDGTVVKMVHIAAPDRSNLPQSNLLPGAQPRTTPRTLSVPGDVLKLPWEATARKPGAAPARVAAPAAPARGAVAPAPVPAAVQQAAPVAAAADTGGGSDEETLRSFLEAVLAGNKTLKKTQARVGIFTGMNKAKFDAADRDRIMKLFTDEDSLGALLSTIGEGYAVDGDSIIAMA